MNEKIEKVVDVVKNAAYEVTDKAGTAKEILRLNYTRSKTEQDIRDTYAELGRVLYESGMVPECPEADEMDRICGKIDDLLDRLRDIKDAINLIKGKAECPVCGKTYSDKFQFCPSCGEELRMPVGEYDDEPENVTKNEDETAEEDVNS